MTTVVLFVGNPEGLKVALEALITGGATLFEVVPTHQKGKYIIIHNKDKTNLS